MNSPRCPTCSAPVTLVPDGDPRYEGKAEEELANIKNSCKKVLTTPANWEETKLFMKLVEIDRDNIYQYAMQRSAEIKSSMEGAMSELYEKLQNLLNLSDDQMGWFFGGDSEDYFNEEQGKLLVHKLEELKAELKECRSSEWVYKNNMVSWIKKSEQLQAELVEVKAILETTEEIHEALTQDYNNATTELAEVKTALEAHKIATRMIEPCEKHSDQPIIQDVCMQCAVEWKAALESAYSVLAWYGDRGNYLQVKRCGRIAHGYNYPMCSNIEMDIGKRARDEMKKRRG